jgi:hypothetical protein
MLTCDVLANGIRRKSNAAKMIWNRGVSGFSIEGRAAETVAKPSFRNSLIALTVQNGAPCVLE